MEKVICPRKNQEPTGVDFQMPNDANDKNLWKNPKCTFFRFRSRNRCIIEHIFFLFFNNIVLFYLVPDAYNANISKTKTKTRPFEFVMVSPRAIDSVI